MQTTDGRIAPVGASVHSNFGVRIAAPLRVLTPASRQRLTLYLFLAPFALSTALFGIWPIAESMRIAFLDSYSALSAHAHFVGLANFRSVIGSPEFRDSLWRTLLYTSLGVPINVLLALGLGLFLAQKALKRGRTLFKLAIFLPVVCPEAASFIVLKTMFNQDYGAVNRALLSLGLPPFGGLITPATAFATLLSIETWSTVGLYTLIFLTNIQLLDQSLSEAAAIDGASRAQALWRIVIPQLRPAIVVNAIYALIEFLKTFSVVYIVSRGGPRFSTMFISYFAWMKFSSGQYGEATAVASILFVVVLILTSVSWWLAERSDYR
jgi:ABC-type sugar transport system permease subunit